MPEIDIYNMEGEKQGVISLSEDVFGLPANIPVLSQALIRQLANRRRGTASTKTRGEIRGGGRKPWRQKGTGRARHGSIRSPLWVGGAKAFGPKPRDFSQKMPKKMRRLALKSALSSKVSDKDMIAIDVLEFEAPKTKVFIEMMKNLKLEEKALFIIEQKNRSLEKSASNIPGVKVITTDSINIHDLFKYKHLVMTKDAIEKVEEVMG
ncbi:MAG: 50S ribosomal protein L4 [Candidatus Eremiobacteraeota bacterium]|nr:50S ribosomal protein L4 [Candidatus Eremiobacteraeota bacterium]